jgi:hypothetical protein
MTVKKASATKKVVAANKKRVSAAKSAATRKKPPVDEAIHYYLGPDGKVVREVLNVPEPKRLSKYGEWRRARPNGIAKIVDKKALQLIKKGFSPLEALRLSVKIDEVKEAKCRCAR